MMNGYVRLGFLGCAGAMSVLTASIELMPLAILPL